MSTKIFNGYKLPNWDTRQLHKFCREFQSKIRDLATELYNKELLILATEVVDTIAVSGKFPSWVDEKVGEQMPIQLAWSFLDKKSREKHGDGQGQYNCHIILIPSSDKILALYYGDRHEYTAVWERMEGVESYPYWNNTDRPDDVSDEEWEKRGEEWDAALDGEFSVPIVAGWQVSCFGDYDKPFPETDEYAPRFIPDFNDRANGFARNALWVAYVEEHKPKETHQFVTSFREFHEWLDTEKGQKKLKAALKRVSAKLKKKLTKQDLRKMFKEAA